MAENENSSDVFCRVKKETIDLNDYSIGRKLKLIRQNNFTLE